VPNIPSVRTTTTTLLDDLRRHDSDTAALVAGGRTLTYAELLDAVGARATELDLGEPAVVVLAGDRSLDWVISYLALQAARHVPLLAADPSDRLVARWNPAAVVRADATGWSLERRFGPAADLHPDLALLMSTSGSTGSPKLVRLSHENLVANARSIGELQQLTSSDRAITTLPLHYSFGLSILHSHLLAGGSVVVSDASVVDRCFAAALRDHAVTNVAGVPHTYEMLESVGPERVHVPSLRFLAHAGGRMAPDRVAMWAARAERWGVDWFTMYGQTEATARIAYVPPRSVGDHPGAIGLAIPDGELSIEPIADVDDRDVGEIVYRGPNVMLGYATEPEDLARGRDVSALRTGDLGRRDPESGLFEVVGRLSRRVKPYGLRIDLDDVECRLAEVGITAHVAGDDELLVAAAPGAEAATVAAALVEATGLPAQRIHVLDGAAPRTASGKVDAAAMLVAARVAADDPATSGLTTAASARDAALVDAYATVLGRRDVGPDDTFVSLGGDSLSYVECSIRIERILGRLPSDWHLRPIGELAEITGRRRLARVDTTVVLRAVGILLVVATHMRLRHVPGGAHLLLGVVGYNLARFLLPIDVTRDRLRAGVRTVARVAVPTVAWAVVFGLLGHYGWTTLSLANNYLGPRSHAGNHWHFWFVEVFTHLVLITTAVVAIPWVRRLDVRFAYGFPLVLLALALTLRMDWADMGDWYNTRFRTHSVAWFFVLGWLVQRSGTIPQRLATTVICLATAPGVFDNPRREMFIAGGLILLVWVKELPMPRVLVRPVATIAAASMWILISHFMIWPPMTEWFVVEVAYVLTVAASVGVWWLVTRAPGLVDARLGLTGRRPARRAPVLSTATVTPL
jgi:acyl-CoA synthetase (AMP-forming)/AMP-acid ligase II